MNVLTTLSDGAGQGDAVVRAGATALARAPAAPGGGWAVRGHAWCPRRGRERDGPGGDLASPRRYLVGAGERQLGGDESQDLPWPQGHRHLPPAPQGAAPARPRPPPSPVPAAPLPSSEGLPSAPAHLPALSPSSGAARHPAPRREAQRGLAWRVGAPGARPAAGPRAGVGRSDGANFPNTI